MAKETAWRRALRDSESFRHSGKFFWGFEVLGAAALAAVVTYFFLPDNPSRFESAVYPLTGVVTGFVAAYSLIYLWNLFRAPYRQRDELRTAIQAAATPEKRPVLRFSEPRQYPRETFTRTWRFVMQSREETRVVPFQVQLWRVELANTEPETVAKGAKVRLESDPTLPVFPVSVHEKHDNNAPYRQERDVRYGEPIEFDLIAKGTDNDSVYMLRSDMGEGYVHQLSQLEREAIRARLWENGWTLILRVVADPPAQGHVMSYRAVVDGDGKLRLEEDPAYAEIALVP